MALPVCIETPTRFARYTVADAIAIPLNTPLDLSGANTAVTHDTNGEPFAGLAWEEKTASDGITEIVAALDGVWDFTCDSKDEIANGAEVTLSGASTIRAAVAADLLTGATIGRVLEVGAVSTAVRTRLGYN